MFGQSLLSAFGIACTTDTDQLFPSTVQATSVATYQLNNATTSIPSNTYPGTPTNITYGTGKFGNAAVFNGSSSHIDIPSPIPYTNTDLSFSCWFNLSSSFSSGFKTIIGAGNKSSGEGIIRVLLRYDSTNNYKIEPVRAFSGNSYYTSSSNYNAQTITAGIWYNLLYTYSSTGNTAKIYLNGSLISTTNLTTTSTDTNSGVLSLGQYRDSSSTFNWNGSIDQVRIFNTALPQAAVTALYNETTTTAQSASIDYVSANPNSIAYYKMSDATDQLGNYNGTATNVNFNTEGKFGFAGAFNGSSSYIALPALGNSYPFSYSCWIYPNETDNNVIINDTVGGARLVVTIGDFFSQTNNLMVAFGGANHLTTATNTITIGSWQHIAVVVNSQNNADIYINGSSVTVTNQGGVTGGSASYHIGSASGTSEFFDGKIDQFRIYDSALSAANVTTLYKEVECEPAAINALENFNTVLYTGNGSGQSISTVGFKPDLVWIKSRSNPSWHALTDSVRGDNKTLFSNETNSEVTYTDSLNSFDTSGFTLGADTGGGSVNVNSRTYVAWNWKAPLANLSTSFNGSSSYLNIPNVNSLFLSKTTSSVSFWFKLLNNSAKVQLFSDYAVESWNYAVSIETNGALGIASRYNSGSIVFTTTSATYDDGNWHHLVVTHDVTALSQKAYIDGNTTPVLTTTLPSGTWSSSYQSTAKINIGHQYLPNTATRSEYLNGSIAQVRIFNDALTSSEVTELYNETASDNSVLNYPAGAGCVAAYPLQTDAVDLSGNYSGASSNVTFGQPGYLTQNTDGTITSTVAANQDAGFSIVKWTGTGSNETIGHGLSSAPELIITKTLSSGVDNNWNTFTTIIDGSYDYLRLNTTAAKANSGLPTPTSSVFSYGTESVSIIAYCFTSIPGYSKIGSYIGTSASGNTVYIGFEPKFLLIKRTTGGAGEWIMYDSARETTSIKQDTLAADSSRAESSNVNYEVDFKSNGFTLNGISYGVNGLNETYIYLAIA